MLENIDFTDGEGILQACIVQSNALELGRGERPWNSEAQNGVFFSGKGKPVRRDRRVGIQAVRGVGGSIEAFHHQAGKFRGGGYAPALGVHEGKQVQGLLVPVLDRHSQETRCLGVIPGGKGRLLGKAGKIGGDVHEQDAQLLHGFIAPSCGGTVKPFHAFFRPGTAGTVRRHEGFPQCLLGYRVAGFGKLLQGRQHARHGTCLVENIFVLRGGLGDCRHKIFVGRVMEQGRFRHGRSSDETDFREGFFRAFRLVFETCHLHGNGLVGGIFKGIRIGAVRGQFRERGKEEGGGGLPRHREGGDGIDGAVYQDAVGVPDGEVQFFPVCCRGNDLEINAGDAQFFRQDGRKPGTGQDGVVKAQTELRQRPRFQRRVFRYFEFRNADGCQIPWRRFRFSHVGACRGLLDGFLDGIDGSAHRGFFHVIQQIKCSRSQQDGACASYQQGHHVAVAAKSACGLPA